MDSGSRKTLKETDGRTDAEVFVRQVAGGAEGGGYDYG